MNVYWRSASGPEEGHTIVRPDMKIGEVFKHKGGVWRITAGVKSSRWQTVLDLTVVPS